MRAVITVIGNDAKGIIAKVSGECLTYNINIIDIAQSVLKDYFAMIMLVDINDINIKFSDFIDKMNEMGKQNSLQIHTMHEDIFNCMHRI